MRNEHDANLSLRPMTHKEWERVINCPGSKPLTKTRPWVDLLRAAVVLVLFASIGVMLGLGV